MSKQDDFTRNYKYLVEEMAEDIIEQIFYKADKNDIEGDIFIKDIIKTIRKKEKTNE